MVRLWGPLQENHWSQDEVETSCGNSEAGAGAVAGSSGGDQQLLGKPCLMVPSGSRVTMIIQASGHVKGWDPPPQNITDTCFSSPGLSWSQGGLLGVWGGEECNGAAPVVQVFAQGKGSMSDSAAAYMGAGCCAVADSERGWSFLCFSEICKVWASASKYIRKELSQKRVSLASCSRPVLPLWPCGAGHKVPSSEPRQSSGSLPTSAQPCQRSIFLLVFSGSGDRSWDICTCPSTSLGDRGPGFGY